MAGISATCGLLSASLDFRTSNSLVLMGMMIKPIAGILLHRPPPTDNGLALVSQSMSTRGVK